jgi:DNA invertase Pin-like site-specific DNA recombinase
MHMPRATSRQPNEAYAIAYIRARADDPTEENRLVAEQRQQCERLAAQIGARLRVEYVDRGSSARDQSRPGYVGVFAHLRHTDDRTRPRYLVMAQPDRFTRSLTIEKELQAALRRAGAQLITSSRSAVPTPHELAPQPVTEQTP